MAIAIEIKGSVICVHEGAAFIGIGIYFGTQVFGFAPSAGGGAMGHPNVLAAKPTGTVRRKIEIFFIR